MPPRPQWWHQLQASKREATLAVDLYNRSGNERHLEAFVIHMTIAWLKLLQAKGQRDGLDLFERQKGKRLRTKDGLDWQYKSLEPLASETFVPNDPRLASLKFFIGLRNKIEHRHERGVAAAVAGRTQAWTLGYEATLTEWFGDEESLADELRFPLFLSSITQDAVASLRRVRARVPVGILEWIQDFDLALEPGIKDDQKFDFRVFLLAHKGPKATADAAMTFVHSGDYTPEQNAFVQQALTIIQDRQIPVANLGALKPTQVARRVAATIGRPFSTNHHHAATQHFEIRPPNNAPNPTLTRADFCRWDATFGQYVYTEAWVAYLERKLADEAVYAIATRRA